MKLQEMVDGIGSKADLVRFIESLLDDLRSHPQDWENSSLEHYLDALARWLASSEWYYRNNGLEVPVSPTWKSIADMLIAAKMYE